MIKSLLIIDDKQEFIDSFQIIAQRKGYQLAFGNTLDNLKEKMPILHREITSVILDIKALLTKEQPIERPDFILSAIVWLSECYPSVPKVILTGDKDAFGFKEFCSNIPIFRKDTEGIERLFEKIDEFQANHENRIRTDNEREILELIAEGESDCLEFKSSFQFCMNANIEKKVLRYEVLKTLVAFSNSNGGSLLIGVKDDGNIIGLEETDYTLLKEGNKKDSYKLLLDGIISENIGASYHREFKLKFYETEGKTICQLKVDNRCKDPIFLKEYKYEDRNQQVKTLNNVFFIRGQARTERLNTEEKKNDYIQRVWGNPVHL